jgi:hypothetical protein
LRQAHEVELIGGVDINEHLHHARQQCEGDAEGWAKTFGRAERGIIIT